MADIGDESLFLPERICHLIYFINGSHVAARIFLALVVDFTQNNTAYYARGCKFIKFCW